MNKNSVFLKNNITLASKFTKTMIFFSKAKVFFLFFLLLVVFSFSLSAQEYDDLDFRERVKWLVYKPRFFGPNAFRIQELHTGRLSSRWEIEARGEYHYYVGDQTKNIFGRLYIPIANGKAGIEIRGVVYETYQMDKKTQHERNAVVDHPPVYCRGDLIISSYYQLLKSDKLCDIAVSSSIKTTTGNRLCDARYTDAAAYWFELTTGRNLLQTADQSIALRAQGMLGFYCWMTNDLVHRQNDAILYGYGGSLKLKSATIAANWSGFHGYMKHGDRPVVFRSKIDLEVKKNILSLRFNHGIRDFLYDTYSVGIIRCF